jgi:hypothetical protein
VVRVNTIEFRAPNAVCIAIYANTAPWSFAGAAPGTALSIGGSAMGEAKSKREAVEGARAAKGQVLDLCVWRCRGVLHAAAAAARAR